MLTSHTTGSKSPFGCHGLLVVAASWSPQRCWDSGQYVGKAGETCPRRWRNRCLREATRCVAHHETQEAGHVSAGAVASKRTFAPSTSSSKNFKSIMKLGSYSTSGSHSVTSPTFRLRREPLPRSRWARAVGIVEELVVDVPACVDAGVEYHIQFVVNFCFVDREFPLDRFQDLCESSRHPQVSRTVKAAIAFPIRRFDCFIAPRRYHLQGRFPPARCQRLLSSISSPRARPNGRRMSQLPA